MGDRPQPDPQSEIALDHSLFTKEDSVADLEHPIFAKILVGAKHFGSKSLVITNKLSAEMLRPFQIEMHPCDLPPKFRVGAIHELPDQFMNCPY